MSKFIAGTPSDVLSQALFSAGVVKERPEDVSRIIIDLKAGSMAMIYVETFADTDTLNVLLDAGLKLLADDVDEEA